MTFPLLSTHQPRLPLPEMGPASVPKSASFTHHDLSFTRAVTTSMLIFMLLWDYPLAVSWTSPSLSEQRYVCSIVTCHAHDLKILNVRIWSYSFKKLLSILSSSSNELQWPRAATEHCSRLVNRVLDDQPCVWCKEWVYMYFWFKTLVLLKNKIKSSGIQRSSELYNSHLLHSAWKGGEKKTKHLSSNNFGSVPALIQR